ncbi:MAG: response regulator [Leptolyngbyaceae cyanobacterium RU_5_1]|nr:response regulator [Leptolyngbyaceae cyanobacterium RU_5_1]
MAQSAICNPQFLVSGDAARLQQVIWNLLSNAVKFTPTGGRVEVRLATDAGTDETDKPSASSAPKSVAQITVMDTGRGIAPDFLPHVFDHFRQESVATTRLFGGLGLGLAIVRHLIELHGGTIQVDSPGEGQGATFTVRLPLLQRTEDGGRRTEDLALSTQHSALSTPLAGLQVLIVDDDTDTRDFVEFVLEQAGARVMTVATAGEALMVFNRMKPDVLLSDIGMPEMDGYMLMQQVRALPPAQGGQILAIALTAYAAEIDYQRAIAAGFQKHISKPVEPANLVKVIANLVGQRD